MFLPLFLLMITFSNSRAFKLLSITLKFKFLPFTFPLLQLTLIILLISASFLGSAMMPSSLATSTPIMGLGIRPSAMVGATLLCSRWKLVTFLF
jgi:hypothetical protein